MICPLTMVEYVLLETSKLDVGVGWYYAIIGKPGNTSQNQQLLKGSHRVPFEIWCHENAKSKWVIDDNGILFMSEEDAVLFKMATPHS